MLVLSRKFNEKLVIPLIQTTIQVVSMKAGVVRLGVDAPSRIKVLREEIHNVRELSLNDAGSMVLSRQEKHDIFNQLNTVNLAATMLRTYMEQQPGAGGARFDATAAVIDRLLAASEEIQRILTDAVQESNSPPPASAPKAKPKSVEVPVPVRRRALLVEDDSNERELLAGLLRMNGLDVVTAPDGVDALEFLSQHEECDFALIDMMLPKKDGLSTIREIRQDHAHDKMKIFAMTGHSRDEFALDPDGDGIDEWLSKPLNPQKLIQELTAV